MLNEDEKYICVDKEREIALYYSKDLGKRRIYRPRFDINYCPMCGRKVDE